MGTYSEHLAIIPDDNAPLPKIAKAIYTGSGGDIMLRGIDADILFSNVTPGTVLPVRPSHIRATGTTAENMVGRA